jgi:DNA mismatch repair protein MutL
MINILPPSVYNLLAAGEVVENPSAIVKECVENSIDAGATFVEIEITRGGLDRITICDNGCGVGEDDMEKVFLPHATSKIKNAKDLESIATLGFRGEAMASIAAVSIVDFTSRAKDKLATTLHIEGGKIMSRKQVAKNQGTSVVVSNLFYNTPARIKFLRDANQEKNAVTKTVQGFMLANPKLHVLYKIDEEVVYDYKGSSLVDALQTVYEVSPSDLVKINIVKKPFLLSGFVGNPDFVKRNKTYQTVFVNGRAVEGGVIADAVNAVYQNFMVVGGYPFFCLNLCVDFCDVDVNVHPKKAQVKFSNPQEIFDFVKDAVSGTVDDYLHQKHAIHYDTKKDSELLEQIRITALSSKQPVNNHFVKAADHILNKYDLKENPILEQQKLDLGTPKFKVLGTIFNTYILIDDNKALHIIDQHAAHERLLYDKLFAQINSKKIEQQRLLTPITLMLSSDEMSKMEKVSAELNNCGIECSAFGTNCFRITAVPAFISSGGIDILTNSLLADVKNTKVSLNDIFKDQIVKSCCVAAIKGGQKLDIAQATDLIQKLIESKHTLTCPHGRPIVVSLTQSQIEKMLKRIV